MDNLIIPGLLILVLGSVLRMTYKGSRNYFFGYRTRRTLDNMDNWNVANKTSSIYFVFSGLAGIIAGIFAHYFIPKETQFEFLGLIIVTCLIISIYFTEKALNINDKKNKF